MTDALVKAVARAFAKVGRYHDDVSLARAALAAIEAQCFVIVPKTPTAEMIAHASGFQQGEHIYAAFLSARPKQEDGK